MSFEVLQKKLEDYPKFRKAPGFEVVKAVMNKIGYADTCPMIHVVGTNGKGSVASMLSHILVCHGLNVGTFTSPHLVDIRERMTVNNKLMNKEQFVENYLTLKTHIDAYMDEGGERPTFFEMMFLLAIMHFHESSVEVMVVEAGIGGRHDTTNVLNNRWLNVLTSISMDHTAILGNTIEAIVNEKAAISRKGITTVALVENQEIEVQLRRITKEKMAKFVPITPFDGRILERGKEFIDFSLDTKYYSYERLSIRSNADYQLTNTKIAVTAMHELSDHMEVIPEKIIRGLEAFSWPGRMEYVYPWLLADGAHNLAGIELFKEHLNKYEKNTFVDILFACMNDKDYEDMCRSISEINRLGNVYLPDIPFLRATENAVLMEAFHRFGVEHVTVIDRLNDFLSEKKSEVGARTLLGAVGSLYLIGEIKKYRGGPGND